VNFIGHGLHLFWFFKEGLEATEKNKEIVEQLLRLLADHLGGDISVCEVSRLLRLPGTHNSKENGEWIEVVNEQISDRRYDLTELADWLEIVSPVIHRKPVENDHDNGAGADNPWLAVAERFGSKPPVDVEARLAAMTYQGPGDASIHGTQVSVSAALLNRGQPIDEVVEIVLDATRAAAGDFGTRWNWRREERAIRKMCETWLAKHPEVAEAQSSDDSDKSTDSADRQKQPEAPPLLRSYVWRPFSEIPRRTGYTPDIISANRWL
jgi:RepB DNA-primase from phage plasmid